MATLSCQLDFSQLYASAMVYLILAKDYIYMFAIYLFILLEEICRWDSKPSTMTSFPFENFILHDIIVPAILSKKT